MTASSRGRGRPCDSSPAPPLPSFSLSIRTFFSATISFVRVSRARSGRTGHSVSTGKRWLRYEPLLSFTGYDSAPKYTRS